MKSPMIGRTLSIALLCVLSAFVSRVFAGEYGTSNENPHRISSTPITLDIHFHYHYKKSGAYNNDWPVEKRASQLTGVSLNNTTATGFDSGNEAFNLLMASGEMPDIVGGTDLREKFNQFGPLGHFVPLNDLIKEYAPNINGFFEKNPDLLKAISAADGKLYHIPYIPDGKFGRAYFIRQDWLKKLGLQVPDNSEELYNVLTKFKHEDPNGNGQKDEVPFFYRDYEEMARLVTLWDARTTGTDTWHDFYIENSEVRHGYTETNYKTGISHLAKWYAEGLLARNEDPAQTRHSRKTLLSSNRGGMTHDWFASTASFNDRLALKIEGFDFKPMPPPATVSGKRIEEHRRSAVKPDGWAITSSNKAVVDTIKYFEFWFTPVGRRLANFGVEGQEYTLVDGKPIFKDQVINGAVPVNKRLWSVGAQIPRGFWQDYEYEEQWTNQIALDGIKLYEKGNYLLKPFHGVTLNEAEKATFDFYWSEILQFMLERQEQWISGTRDVKKDWNPYLAQLDKMGLKKVMAVMQSAYNRQYGSSGLQQSTLVD